MYKLITAPEAGEYIAWLEQQNLTDPVHKGMLREMKKSYERLVKILLTGSWLSHDLPRKRKRVG